MKVRTPQLLALICSLTLVVPRISQAGSIVATYSYSQSLYDQRSAELPDPYLQSIFGPRSGHIHYDSRMIAAAEIAQERAHRHSTEQCWHSVKNALVDAQVISTRPTTEYAKEAGDELQTKYGFTKLRITSPFDAPVGAVIVYGGRGAGHVEIRTATGFVSDFFSSTPSPRPLLGIYVKRS
ncbi:MAG: hypothetical protein ABSE62_05630 [Chthoniobacteraceae bacterium]|jgi:hypothetical protein